MNMERSPDGRSYTGEAQVNYFRLQVLYRSLYMHQETGMIPTRGMSRRRMLDMAEQYTGTRYKGSAKGSEAAMVSEPQLPSQLVALAFLLPVTVALPAVSVTTWAVAQVSFAGGTNSSTLRV